MIRVKATREGLQGHKTASGYIADQIVSFVALPDTKALGRHVRVINPINGRSVIAQVLRQIPPGLDKLLAEAAERLRLLHEVPHELVPPAEVLDDLGPLLRHAWRRLRASGKPMRCS